MPADPPLVTRVDEGPPLVVRPAVRPGLWEAVLYTLAYAAVVFGTLIAVIGLAVGWDVVVGRGRGLEARADGEPGTVPRLPPGLHGPAMAGVVLAYLAGTAFTVVVLRRVAGPGWARELGLDRLPASHLVLAVVAFPAFTVGSDLLAGFVTQLFGADPFQEEATKSLADLLGSFHWSVAVLAVGICPGVAEELWCRGFLGRGLVGRYGPWLGVFLTSTLFGLLHLYPPAYVLVTAVMGAVLHFTYLMSRSLWVPILLHVLNNSLAALGPTGMLPESFGVVVQKCPTPAATCVFITLLAAGVGVWVARVRPGRRAEDVWAGLLVGGGIAAISSVQLVRELWP
jgi:membrane protease YdiL (CAAX protease family)